MTGTLLIVAGLTMLAPSEETTLKPEALRAAVTKGLPLIVKSMADYQESRNCFSCHHQAVPILAVTTAKSRGFQIDPNLIQSAIDYTEADLKSALASYVDGKGQGGGVSRAGYALVTLDLAGIKANKVTDAVVGYLLKHDDTRDHWRGASRRPPTEGSDFTTTYVALRGLAAFGKDGQKNEIGRRFEKARTWLETATPKDTEDRVFRLLALKQTAASLDSIKRAADDLRQLQRHDGGWSQLDGGESDAYATATALVSLHMAGGGSTDATEYQRGLRYLIANQRGDGTWFVASRSKPVQPYFESGFPYGKDQFISMAASAWSVTALSLGCSKE